MSSTQAAAFSFQAGPLPPEALGVLAFSGVEALSRPFSLQVDFFPRQGEPLDTASLPGQPARLTVQVGEGTPRHVHGLVRAVEELGPQGGRLAYRVWLVPRLWLLTRVHRSRIFQGQSVPEVVRAVLKEAGVSHRLALSSSYAAREYCTQYRETDLAFISRLLEWEGIFYFFEHSEDGHVLVLGDAPSVHPPVPGGPRLPLRERDGRAADGEYVFDLEQVHRVRPSKVHLKDFDFEKPALDVSGQQEEGGEQELEVYDYPAEYVAPSVGKAAAKVRLQEATQAARTLQGQAVSPRLTAGHRFEVESPGESRWEGGHVLVEVHHFGHQPQAPGGRETLLGLYSNSFKAMPKGVAFRPRRLTPAPLVHGPQTATVVGPSGEEIHTDGHGRIKVQFHWDRKAPGDDTASCWVRVAQAWGGPTWGALYLPRVGQEVLVRYLEGNPDRPLVSGVLYNGTNPTPYALPDEKTKSTLKSASSPGSEGFNELRLEDAAGEEEVFVHAQKDENLITENDKDQQVRAYEDLLVKKDRSRTVEGNQRLEVSLDDVSLVEGNQSLQVRGNRATTTRGSHDESVEKNQTVTVGKNFTALISNAVAESVGAGKALTIGAGYSINVALALNEAVGGVKSSEIGGAHTELVAGSRQESVAKDKEVKVGGDWDLRIKGQLSLTLGKDLTEQVGKECFLAVTEPAAALAKKFELKADKFSLIVGDHLVLSMEKSGKVAFNVKTLTVDGSQVKIKGKSVKMEAAGSLVDKSVKAKELKDLEEAKPLNVEFEIKDPEGKPIKDQPFELHMPDGTIKKGRVDGSGKGKMEKVPAGDYRIVFPELGGRVNKGV